MSEKSKNADSSFPEPKVVFFFAPFVEPIVQNQKTLKHDQEASKSLHLEQLETIVWHFSM